VRIAITSSATATAVRDWPFVFINVHSRSAARPTISPQHSLRPIAHPAE
jgi:hypothetical protein